MEKLKLILNSVVFCLVIGVILVIFLATPEKKESLSERRPLKTFEEVMNGENHPFDEFEGYFLDQFPFRESFRMIKTYYNMDLLGKENNGIYKLNGSYIKMEENLDKSQVEYAADVINRVIEKENIQGNIYYSIIPDKHYYGSKLNGYPALDYDELFSIMSEKLDTAEYIDITDKLSLSDYYTTDPHWSQDKITGVAQDLVSAMNPGTSIEPDNGWETNVLEPYYGLYQGQLAIDMPADKIVYLTSDASSEMKVTVITEDGKKTQTVLYPTELFHGKDPYDVFISGAVPYVEINNPSAENDKTLVVFRDSFGSSIAPLMAHGYSKVVLVDLRYMFPDLLRNFVKFDENTDVLFLYSTGLLNGGRILRDYMSNK